jgi:surfeit locus 1 family protein
MNYHFLLTPRWIIFLVVGAVLAVMFTSLGFWQLNRLEQRKARNVLIQSRLVETPRALFDLTSQYDPDVAAFEDTSLAHRPVVVHGVYDTNHEVLFRTTQNYQGLPGYYVLTPLIVNEKQAVLVMRGWVPFEMDTLPLSEALPPSEVEIVGTVELELKPTPGMLSALIPKDPPGNLSITAYIDTERLEQQMPYDLLPFYIRLEQQTPAQTLDFPKPLQRLEFTDGPHLGYAIQWFSFTAIGIIGYVLLIRKMGQNGVEM